MEKKLIAPVNMCQLLIGPRVNWTKVYRINLGRDLYVMFIYEGVLEQVRIWIHVHVIPKWHFENVFEITLENTALMNENLNCLIVEGVVTCCWRNLCPKSLMYMAGSPVLNIW